MPQTKKFVDGDAVLIKRPPKFTKQTTDLGVGFIGKIVDAGDRKNIEVELDLDNGIHTYCFDHEDLLLIDHLDETQQAPERVATACSRCGGNTWGFGVVCRSCTVLEGELILQNQITRDVIRQLEAT